MPDETNDLLDLQQQQRDADAEAASAAAFDAAASTDDDHAERILDADNAAAEAPVPDDDDAPAHDAADGPPPAPPETREDPGAAGPADSLRRPGGTLEIPDDTKGYYVVLYARKPARGEDQRPQYVEVDCVKASGPNHAKSIVMGEAPRSKHPATFAEFLKASAAQKPGILLRAVPAQHWPRDVKPTRTIVTRTLEIG